MNIYMSATFLSFLYIFKNMYFENHGIDVITATWTILSFIFGCVCKEHARAKLSCTPTLRLFAGAPIGTEVRQILKVCLQLVTGKNCQYSHGVQKYTETQVQVVQYNEMLSR